MEKIELMQIVGENLGKLRIERGYTQEEVAEKAGISTSFCANIESGKKAVSILVLRNLADVLEVSADSLMYEYSPEKRIHDIELLLRDKPDWFIMSIDKMVRLCLAEFLHEEKDIELG